MGDCRGALGGLCDRSRLRGASSKVTAATRPAAAASRSLPPAPPRASSPVGLTAMARSHGRGCQGKPAAQPARGQAGVGRTGRTATEPPRSPRHRRRGRAEPAGASPASGRCLRPPQPFGPPRAAPQPPPPARSEERGCGTAARQTQAAARHDPEPHVAAALRKPPLLPGRRPGW